jgi:hypothetical protein
MRRFRNIAGLFGAAIGLITLLYVAWQFATYGRLSSEMADVLRSELSTMNAPDGVTLLKRGASWEPGWARASEYYKSPLSHEEIAHYYATLLAGQHWTSGPMARTRPLTKVALVYHKEDREFRLTFAAPGSEATYEVTLLWVHSSQ